MKALTPLLLLAAPAFAASAGYVLVDGAAIPEPLDGLTGDAARGAELAAQEEPGCLACHGGAEAPPLVALIGGRDAGALRLSLVALSAVNDSIGDHDYFDPYDVGEVEEELIGQTRLSAQQIEDLLAWLEGLR